MPTARLARALVLAVCLLLAVPALASAATFTVDTNYDEGDSDPGNGVCEANVASDGKCTLRAAIQESNATVAEVDSIIFGASQFKGDAESVVFVGAGLPELDATVNIVSGSCAREGGGTGPCAGVQADPGGTAFSVDAPETSISGLAIGGGSNGIYVEADGFTATSNWIGFNLEGGSSSITIGVFVAPGTEGATIGGTEATQRNVFGNLGNGLDIEGASETTVRGNYFGVGPDGSTAAANFRDIEVSDSTASGGFAAAKTEIGATVSAGAAASSVCDGGCNVVGAAYNGATGIDLNGDGEGQNEAPATGPTTIHGNHVGLDAAGTAVVAKASTLILAGSADDAIVGGPGTGDANFIVGGGYGVYGENGDNLEVVGNTIGSGPTGTAMTPPTTIGIFAFALAVSDLESGAFVAGNSVRMAGGVGIEHRFTGAEIINNTVEGGQVGILSRGGANGSLIGGNVVRASEEAGIEVRNPDNEVLGNEIRGSEGAGILVNPGATIAVSGNVVGGDTSGSENAIFESGDNAIRITGIEASFNEVRRNRGGANGAEFIVIRPYNGFEGDPNGGIQTPTVATAAKSEASGKAQAGALVRVFRKASSDPGELAGFLGSAVADGNGDWKATYPPQSGGTIVVATQTLNGGSSSLGNTAVTPPDPPAPPSGCPAVPSACPPPADTTKPRATIKKAPKAKSTSTTAKFAFSASEKSTFRCKLDKKAWAKCKSPKTYKNLKPGKHVFKLKAADAAGNVSKVLTRKFTVLE